MMTVGDFAPVCAASWSSFALLNVLSGLFDCLVVRA